MGRCWFMTLWETVFIFTWSVIFSKKIVLLIQLNKNFNGILITKGNIKIPLFDAKKVSSFIVWNLKMLLSLVLVIIDYILAVIDILLCLVSKLLIDKLGLMGNYPSLIDWNQYSSWQAKHIKSLIPSRLQKIVKFHFQGTYRDITI